MLECEGWFGPFKQCGLGHGYCDWSSSGPGRGDTGADLVFDNVAGNGVFTAVGAPSDDDTDGYTIFVTFSEDEDSGNTVVSITSTGLDADFDFSSVVETGYEEFVSYVTPNVSVQNGVLNLSSMGFTFPSLGTDGDGIRNNADPDDNNNGINDDEELAQFVNILTRVFVDTVGSGGDCRFCDRGD